MCVSCGECWVAVTVVTMTVSSFTVRVPPPHYPPQIPHHHLPIQVSRITQKTKANKQEKVNEVDHLLTKYKIVPGTYPT